MRSTSTPDISPLDFSDVSARRSGAPFQGRPYRAVVRAHIRGTVTPPSYDRSMTRPKTYVETRVATAVRLPASVHRRLHDAARDRDVSANLLVTRAVTEFLDRLPPAAEALTTHPDDSRLVSLEAGA